MTNIEGVFPAAQPKIGIIVARFNEFITSKLLSAPVTVWSGTMSATQTLMSAGCLGLLKYLWQRKNGSRRQV